MKNENLIEHKKGFKINSPFLCFLLYVLYIWFNDMADLICYMINLPQTTIISRIIILILMIFIFLVLKKYILIEKGIYSKTFLIGAGIILLWSLIIAIIPDFAEDSVSYHIHNQFPGFYDNINNNFMSAYKGTFMFPLSDRLFYLFREILGYRYGTLLNTIMLIVSYYQINKILNLLIGKKLEFIRNEKNNLVIKFFAKEEILSFFCLFSIYIWYNLGTYMVDISVFPIVLELLKKIIETDMDGIKGRIEIVYMALLGGLALTLKLTNMVVVLPIFLIYLFQIINQKKLTIKIFSFSIFIGCFPMIIYMIYNYKTTGNPVSGFYNSIFMSPYFPLDDGKDLRWGGQTFIEKIIWPIIMVIRPTYRQSEFARSVPYQSQILFGLISSIGIIVYLIKNKSFTKSIYSKIAIVFILTIYLWSFTTGYPRYIIIGEVLASIIFIVFMVNLYSQKDKINRCIKVIVKTLGVLYIAQAMITISILLFTDYNLKWAPSVLKEPKYYLQNFKYVLRDRGTFGSEEQKKKIDKLIMGDVLGGVASIYDNKVPIIDSKYIYNYLPNSDATRNKYNISSNEIRNSYIKKINEWESNGEGLYAYDETFKYSNLDERYNNSKLYIKNIDFINSYFILNQSPLLIEVGPLPENKKNSLLYVGNKESEEKNQLQVSLDGKNKNVKLTGIAALAPYVTWSTPDTVLKLVATDGKVTKDVFEKEIEPRKFYKIDEMINMSEFTGNVKLKFVHLTTDEKETGWGTMTVLNPEITTFD